LEKFVNGSPIAADVAELKSLSARVIADWLAVHGIGQPRMINVSMLYV
jgi:hypothetical protein